MRVVRFRRGGQPPRYGVSEGEVILPIQGSPFGRSWILGDAVARDEVSLLAPVEPGKIFGIGRNYRTHVEEMGLEVPESPSIFMKPPNSVIGPGEDVVLPPRSLSRTVQHEAELAIVIGRPARNVAAADALQVIFGYTCSNDVSARDLQRSDTSAIRAKGFDTFCPVGPWIETELDVEAGIDIVGRVNGEVRQTANTTDLIFDIGTVVAHLSQFSTLLPGDLILTGSPSGTADLSAGDKVDIEVPGIGTLSHGVVDAR